MSYFIRCKNTRMVGNLSLSMSPFLPNEANDFVESALFISLTVNVSFRCPMCVWRYILSLVLVCTFHAVVTFIMNIFFIAVRYTLYLRRRRRKKKCMCKIESFFFRQLMQFSCFSSYTLTTTTTGN